MNRYLFFVFAGILSDLMQLQAQVDSSDYQRIEGLYLNYIQFKENKPIRKYQIMTNIDTNQLDFFTKVVSQREIQIQTNKGEVMRITPSELWGYYQNNSLYIYYENAFYKVPVLGAISYFIGTQEVTYYSYSGIGMGVIGYPYGIGGMPVKAREMRDFLLDYNTGKVYPFSIERLEELLKQDEEIYKMFTSLNRRTKKKKYTYYIRLFNEKHPVK